MSDISNCSIENLPVEIFHRIFDDLDIQTIFFSIRSVCRLFQSIVNSYDRLDFHLKNVSKTNFDLLCQMISPRNIRSLTLHNNKKLLDQISVFLAQIDLRQLTQLHSIHLYGIDEFQFNYLCRRINLNLLKAFSIKIDKYDDRRKNTTDNRLSKIVQQSNLRNIHFNIQNNRLSDIDWPMSCSIECLTLNGDITFDTLVKIFSCSPRLHRLIIEEKFSSLIDHCILTSSFPQLRSLAVEQIDVTINQLESFLLLTPSLTDLKLIGDCRIFDGKRWEEFLQGNLPHLDQFQFHINCQEATAQTREDFELIIQPYQSPFWIDCKKWFVEGELDLQHSNRYQIYSIPICKSIYQTEFHSNKISLSTSNDILITKNISQLIFRFKKRLTKQILKAINISYFPNVTKLHVYFNGKFHAPFLDYLPRIINISQLTEVFIELYYSNESNQNCLKTFMRYLNQSSKLSSLTISNYISLPGFSDFYNIIFQNLPPQINHLKIPVENVKQIEMIFKRCHRLAVLELKNLSLKSSAEIKQWFEQNTINSVFQRYPGCDTIWIGTTIKQEIFNHKRIKLTIRKSDMGRYQISSNQEY